MLGFISLGVPGLISLGVPGRISLRVPGIILLAAPGFISLHICHLYLCLPKTPSPCNPWSCLVAATAQIGLSEISPATWAAAILSAHDPDQLSLNIRIRTDDEPDESVVANWPDARNTGHQDCDRNPKADSESFLRLLQIPAASRLGAQRSSAASPLNTAEPQSCYLSVPRNGWAALRRGGRGSWLGSRSLFVPVDIGGIGERRGQSSDDDLVDRNFSGTRRLLDAHLDGLRDSKEAKTCMKTQAMD